MENANAMSQASSNELAKTWMEHFNISPMEIAEWQSYLHGDESLISWALFNGKISERDYLAWASKHYELPSIKLSFFSEPADHELWNNFKSFFPWRQDLLPLAEWQGLLLVACVEPPAQISLSYPYRFILAPASGLAVLWAELNNNNSIETPSGFTSHGPISDHVTPNDKNIAGKESILSQKVLDATLIGLDFSSLTAKIDTPNFTPKDTPKTIEVEQPSATVRPSIQYATDQNAPDRPSVLGAANPPAALEPTAVPHTPNTAALPSSDHEVIDVPSAQELLEKIENRLEVSQVFDLNVLAQNGGANPTPKVALRPTKLVPLERCQTYDEIAEQSLMNIKNSLEDSMILLFQSGELRPWKWSDGLTSPSSQQIAAINLVTPSIFKIVYKTGLPYHGNLVPNSVNSDFLNRWRQGVAPRHVSLLPLVIDSQLCGMVLGMSDHEVPQRETLTYMEGITNGVATHFRRLRLGAAAA
jgi:hypothetical protein